jgi:hypothetical protein
MDKWICKSCHAIFCEDDLFDDEDGLCEYCQSPLIKMGEENKELDLMIYSITHYNIDEIWENIESIDNWIERTRYRALFYEALKITKKTFDLKEGE